MSKPEPDKQRAFATKVAADLRKAGYEALWAGGCVRDFLLGVTPKDYDVATNATPDQIREVFGHRRTLAIGAAFGVISVLGPPNAGQIDVATFRRDVSYSDGRRPDAVSFSSAQEDAQRRDFTINGLFYDPASEQVIDYVEGERDLKGRVVRAIGNPAERFAEDKLRLLRAVRFTATLDFSLDPKTRAAAEAMASEIVVVSAERIAQEMRRILVDQRRVAGLQLLRDTCLMPYVLPEATPLFENAEGLPRTIVVLNNLARPTFPLALAATLHAGGDSLEESVLLVQSVAARWKLSNDEGDRAEFLMASQRLLDDAASQRWSKLQRLLIHPGAAELIELVRAKCMAAGVEPSAVAYCEAKLKQDAATLNPPPLVTGNDLQKLGIAPGPSYKRLLDTVRDAQLDNEIVTRDEALALVGRIHGEREE